MEFELFGRRLKADVQRQRQQKSTKKNKITSYEMTVDSPTSQRVTTNTTTDAKPGEAFNLISRNDDLTNGSKSESKDSLKARIEELETDSIIKNQNIEKQKFEIKQLREELNRLKSDLNVNYLKQEIEELNDFKINFMLVFESFEQTKAELKELKIKFKQNEFENDRLLAEKLQFDEKTFTEQDLYDHPLSYNNFIENSDDDYNQSKPQLPQGEKYSASQDEVTDLCPQPSNFQQEYISRQTTPFDTNVQGFARNYDLEIARQEQDGILPLESSPVQRNSGVPKKFFLKPVNQHTEWKAHRLLACPHRLTYKLI
ncbi:16012_t:CDS:2 [Funneliformis caledonium]|uniref:16012_t:CDS:1 n=1 Tax=Funneliformis caledonium TaxID=1117310 RepID=A0A9N9AW74_9GLOM|nr:16012_t:CDS:2 [Funneliformis caledonium]